MPQPAPGRKHALFPAIAGLAEAAFLSGHEPCAERVGLRGVERITAASRGARQPGAVLRKSFASCYLKKLSIKSYLY